MGCNAPFRTYRFWERFRLQNARVARGIGAAQDVTLTTSGLATHCGYHQQQVKPEGK